MRSFKVHVGLDSLENITGTLPAYIYTACIFLKSKSDPKGRVYGIKTRVSSLCLAILSRHAVVAQKLSLNKQLLGKNKKKN